MTTHTHAPAIREHGLQDDCGRCAQHAEHPFESLDDDNLRALIQRTQAWMHDEPSALPRSAAELGAMTLVERSLLESRVLRRLGIDP